MLYPHTTRPMSSQQIWRDLNYDFEKLLKFWLPLIALATIDLMDDNWEFEV